MAQHVRCCRHSNLKQAHGATPKDPVLKSCVSASRCAKAPPSRGGADNTIMPVHEAGGAAACSASPSRLVIPSCAAAASQGVESRQGCSASNATYQLRPALDALEVDEARASCSLASRQHVVHSGSVLVQQAPPSVGVLPRQAAPPEDSTRRSSPTPAAAPGCPCSAEEGQESGLLSGTVRVW